MPRGPGYSDVAQQSRALEKAVNAFPKVQKSSPLTDDCKILPFLLHTTGSQSFYRATNVTSLYWCQVSHETGNKHRPNCYILRTRWSDDTKQPWPFAEIVYNRDSKGPSPSLTIFTAHKYSRVVCYFPAATIRINLPHALLTLTHKHNRNMNPLKPHATT